MKNPTRFAVLVILLALTSVVWRSSIAKPTRDIPQAPWKQQQCLPSGPFPDAQQLMVELEEGRLPWTRIPDADELLELQAAVDYFNQQCREAYEAQHAVIERIVDEKIASGSVRPTGEATLSKALSTGAIGGRMLMHQGVLYDVRVHLGEDAELDQRTEELRSIEQLGGEVLRSFFQ